MTIVTVQGHGNAGRRKTCFSESTESESATWGTARMNSHRSAPIRAHRQRSAECGAQARSMSGTIDAPAHELRLAGKGRGRRIAIANVAF